MALRPVPKEHEDIFFASFQEASGCLLGFAGTLIRENKWLKVEILRRLKQEVEYEKRDIILQAGSYFSYSFVFFVFHHVLAGRWP